MIIEDHARCIVCGCQNPLGLNLVFRQRDDGCASARWRSDWCYQGYEGVLHGGIIAALLDGAMTHCLFQHGVCGVTCDLKIRFRKTVPCGEELEIWSRLVGVRRSIYRLQAGIVWEGEQMAAGEARFMTINGSGK